MKKVLIIFSLFILIAPPIEAQTFEKAKTENPVLSVDIKTLKYEQRQLVYAILTGDEKSVRTILDSDENPKTTYARIPLIMFAIYENNTDMIKLLISYGFDPNESVMDVTPLELAISMKKYESIEYLLSAGVVPSEADYELVNKSRNKKLKKLFE